MKIELNKPFASNGKVDEFDVRQIKKALNRLGYYQPQSETGITGIPDKEVFAALKKFQKDRKLNATGSANPEDETINALNEEIANKPDGYYIWRTVGDEKVRGTHAELDGTFRAWSDAPDPGEEFNCRCWAEPLSAEKYGPPNCQEEQEALKLEKERFKALTKRKEEITQELRKLFEERDEVVNKMKETLGIEIASFLIGTPISRAEFIYELLQRYFGNIISDEILKTADHLGKERNTILNKIDYKRDQLVVTVNALNSCAANLEKAEQALQTCMNKTP